VEPPKTAPEETTTTIETTTTTPTTPAIEPIAQASVPSEIISITPPPQNAEKSSGSYLTWLWSSPKPIQAKPEKSKSEATTANGSIGGATKATEIKTLTNLSDSSASSQQIESAKPPEPSSSMQNPLITTLPQTKSSWMSFWARSDSVPNLKRTSGPETVQVPENIDSQGRPIKKQKTQDDSSLDIPTTEIIPVTKPTKPTHTPSNSVSSVPNTPTKPVSSPRPETPSKKDKTIKVKLPPPPNHVLPDFESVYSTPPAKPTLLSRVTRAILPTSSTNYPIVPGALHASPRRTSPPKIRKAVAIGIHGFFPLRILRSVLGEPTGTSVKFATLASEAIHRFSTRQYGSPTEIEVVKIALEGEGTVSKRIEMLWQNLKGKEEWMEHIREADLILVACHSQGSPVGAGIIAKLVEEGVVGIERTRLGMLCVAGIHLGPAMDVGQRVVIKAYNAIESEAARELYGTTPQIRRC
jgi:hypothetical protein